MASTGAGDKKKSTERSTNSIDELLLIQQIEHVLEQDRSVLDFRHYTPTSEHTERMKILKRDLPELYDNPALSSRSQWFDHPKWYATPQMPTFHIHFREEMQTVIRSLNDAYISSRDGLTIQTVLAIQDAASNFASCMKNLNGHVYLEEKNLFPRCAKLLAVPYRSVINKQEIEQNESDKLQRQQPNGNEAIEFLFRDHKQLHKMETKISTQFEGFTSGEIELSRNDIISIMQTTLDFDTLLMVHLGEEEEIVVPISLLADSDDDAIAM